MRPVHRLVIGPGGFLGWYLLGVANYIKNNYDLHNVMVGGISAGAIISLATLSKSPMHETLLHPSVMNLVKAPVKRKWKLYPSAVREAVHSTEIDYDRLFVSLTRLGLRRADPFFQPVTLSGFSSQEEAVEYAIASAHVPFLSGNACAKVGDSFFLDGAITAKMDDDLLEEGDVVLHSSMFGREFGMDLVMGSGCEKSLSLFEMGYEDARTNGSSLFSSLTLLPPPVRLENEVTHRKVSRLLKEIL